MTLRLMPGGYSVCRLAADEPVPAWASRGAFFSVTRTPNELSIVCATTEVAAGVRSEHGWRALAVLGPLDFGLVGIIAGVATALAAAGISIFTVSTFDTDYLLVRQADLSRAIEALRAAGYGVLTDDTAQTAQGT